MRLTEDKIKYLKTVNPQTFNQKNYNYQKFLFIIIIIYFIILNMGIILVFNLFL